MSLEQATMFIPTQVTVGYNRRNDHHIYDDQTCKTCSDRSQDNCKKCDYHKSHIYLLAFVTHKNDKGELKQPKSFDKWINKDIPLSELDNTPLEGFKIQQTIKRSSDWFGSGANKWRILDPRGFYVEISSDNLLALIDNVNIIDRTIQDKCIYAWSGKTLSLIPTSTDIYKNAVRTTELAHLSESFKNVKVGDTIILKDCNFSEVLYLGKINVIRIVNNYNDPTTLEYKKQYLLYDTINNRYNFIDNTPKVCKIVSSNENVNVEEFTSMINNFMKRNEDFTNIRQDFNYCIDKNILYCSPEKFEYSDIIEEKRKINLSKYNPNLSLGGRWDYGLENVHYDTKINFIVNNQLYCLGNKDKDSISANCLLYRNITVTINDKSFVVKDRYNDFRHLQDSNPRNHDISDVNNYKYSVYFVQINNTNIYLNYYDISYKLIS